MHISAGKSAYRNKPVILEKAELVKGRDPDSPSTILKKRIRSIPIDFSVSPAKRRNLSIDPFVQTANGPKPNSSILCSENRPYGRIRQSLLRREGGDHKIPKTVEPP